MRVQKDENKVHGSAAPAQPRTAGQTPIYVPVLMIVAAAVIFGAITYVDRRDRRTTELKAKRLLFVDVAKVLTSSSFMDPQLEDVARKGQQRVDNAKDMMREYETRSSKRNVAKWTSVALLSLPALVLFYKRRQGGQ